MLAGSFVIPDEAHRSQYDFIDGFARHMRDALPHAAFVCFTGTRSEKTDPNTRARSLPRYARTSRSTDRSPRTPAPLPPCTCSATCCGRPLPR